ncbi:MAG: hypothetical protein Q9187_008210 [Circinaria calcarea]
MADPFSIFAASVGLALPAGQFIAQFTGVKDEVRWVLQQIKTIADDIAEAETLYHDAKSTMSDEEQFRVTETIKNCKGALDGVARLVEPARRSIATSKTVNIARRVDWIIQKSSAIKSCQPTLGTCQASLQSQIIQLRMINLTLGNQALALSKKTWTGATAREELNVEVDAESASSSDVSSGEAEDQDQDQNHFPTERSSSAEIHRERERYESVRRRLSSKSKQLTIQPHPERSRYKRMQQDHRERWG